MSTYAEFLGSKSRTIHPVGRPVAIADVHPLVVSPFGGVGSEPYMARKLGRKAWACELKRSYFESAVKNLRTLDAELSASTLFDEEVGA